LMETLCSNRHFRGSPAGYHKKSLSHRLPKVDCMLRITNL
jgi:hypothetical protein